MKDMFKAEDYKYNPEIKEDITVGDIERAIENDAILTGVGCRYEDDKLIIRISKGIMGEMSKDEFGFSFSDYGNKTLPTVKVAREVCFIPSKIEEKENGKYIVTCSRKKAQEKCYNEYINKLEVGQVIPATVMRAESYGMFVDVGCGITGVVNIKNIRIPHVIDIEKEAKANRHIYVIYTGRDDKGGIRLSHKELLGTWEQEIERFEVGMEVTGVVSSIADFGVFIAISQNLCGLAEMEKHIEIEEGDTVRAKILSINNEKMKLKLKIIAKDEKMKTLKYKYYIKEGIIKNWSYSTEGSGKSIKTEF